ncbi:MAG: helix-turn-helix domain-containing protein [Candidatus Andersenbacteria bacterium]|nr:helix-turn-helix domain-containing protein [bacterium]MDZ4225605.1 helix-turn-helix domain-containing protein [Candidatus Andersenbacteria bacterium]
MERKLLTISQAAEILGVSIDTLRRWDERGKLVAIKKEGGTHRYYREKDLEIFASDLLKFAFEWAGDKTEFPERFYCQTSAVFQARLVKMERELMAKPGFEELYSLIVLIAGEIGDNSFAHNLGKWPDVPGIFFGYDIKKGVIVLADRGLGILRTLRQVRPELSNHVAAVKVAFTEFISGRAPEKRGNGLKLVREVVVGNPINLFFTSGDAEVRLQNDNKDFKVVRGVNTINGCLAKIDF